MSKFITIRPRPRSYGLTPAHETTAQSLTFDTAFTLFNPYRNFHTGFANTPITVSVEKT